MKKKEKKKLMSKADRLGFKRHEPKNMKQDKSISGIFVAQDQLDYHSLGILTTYEIEKILNEFLEDSYYSNLENVLVVTGKGLIVRPLVEKLLKQHKLVKSFKNAGYYNGQQGAFEVTLISEEIH